MAPTRTPASASALGAELRLGPLGVRAEWQRYANVGGASTGEDDLDVFSLGVLFRF